MLKHFCAAVCYLFSVVAAAEVADFVAPANATGLKNMKAGAVTIAITQGRGAKKPAVDSDGMGYIEFYPGNEMTVTVADGYTLSKITMGTTDYVFMEPVDISAGTLTEDLNFIWTPDEGETVTTVTMTNGTDDPTGNNRKYTQLTAIQVEYAALTAGQMTPEITDQNVSVHASGGLQVTVTLPSAGYELYYKLTPASRADDDLHQGYTRAQRSGKEHTITLAAPGTLSYYALDPTTQTKGLERSTSISGDGTTTAIASLRTGAIPALPASPLYNLQGRRIATPSGRPSLYIQSGRKLLLK